MSDRHSVRRALVLAGAGGVLAAGLIGPGTASAQAAESCSDVEIVLELVDERLTDASETSGLGSAAGEHDLDVGT